MKNAGHPDLIGIPSNYQALVGSGAGADVVCNLVIPTGQIWIVKYLTAYHTDGSANKTIIWYLRDPINAIDILGPFASLAANIRYPFPFATYVPGPFVCSPGGFNVGVLVNGMSAATNVVVEAHVHKIFGVSPLV
jgi:hypothetical protein